MCASLCSSNGQPAIQAKYTYSTLLPAFLLGCVVYASATMALTYACLPQKLEERLGEKVNREQEIMVVLADGGGGDGDNSAVWKKDLVLFTFPYSLPPEKLLAPYNSAIPASRSSLKNVIFKNNIH